jgi:tetratricopeptide (TPR) repeat protein
MPPAYEDARKRALALGPRNAELYNRLAELSARNRLYRQAADFAQQAVALDPRTWRGLGILGLNQLRLGAIAEGRTSLEASFKGDPYNVWIKNTLDLLDTFPKYKETRTEHFQILLHGKEAALLAPYTAELAEDAYAHLSARYGYRPDGPVRVEVYPDHADFSVRTVGLAGLAGLGACFGPVLAIDSPSAREVGQFNWGSTLWHEIAHTFTLGMTGNRVPRWFTEGLVRPRGAPRAAGLGRRRDRGLRPRAEGGRAAAAGRPQPRLHPAEGPEQVANSYLPGVARRGVDRGAARVPGPGRASSRPTATAAPPSRPSSPCSAPPWRTSTRRSSRSSTSASRPAGRHPSRDQGRRARPRPLPRTSPADVEARAKADAGDFEAQLAAGLALFHASKRAEALPYLERAQALFPGVRGAGEPALLPGRHLQGPGQAAGRDTRAPAAHRDRGRPLPRPARAGAPARGPGRPEGGGRFPGQRALHLAVRARRPRALAALSARSGTAPGSSAPAARWSLSIPSTGRRALYQLALALVEAGDAAAARREVLHALEIAPRFQRAQELLLRLHDARAGAPLNEDGGADRARASARPPSSRPGTATIPRRGLQEHAATTDASRSCASASSRPTGVRAGTCGAST